MKKNFLVLISVLLIFSCKEKEKNTSLNQKRNKDFTLKVDSLLTIYEKNGEFMGSLELSCKGKSIYSKTIGYSDIESKKKANSKTKYRIGSVSKIVTAVLTFKAIEENKLSLNETIEKYFPNIKNASKITIANLLQHRSGIHDYTRDEKFFEYRTKQKSPKDMLSIISNYESDFEPNAQGKYSNSNYFILSQIIEKKYNQPFEKVLQEKITLPLGLEDTYSGKQINIHNNESNSYDFSKKHPKFIETDMSLTIGSGAIVSTPKDVNKFITALFTGKLLSTENLSLMKTIEDNYGMGLLQYKINDRNGFGHRGHLDEFRSTSIYFPKENLAFTLLSNGTQVDINNVYIEILKLYFNDAVIELSETEVEKFVGTYVYEKDKKDEVVFIQDKTTLVHIIKGEFKEPLIFKGNNRFVMEQIYGESISFIFSSDGNHLTFEQGNFKGKYIKK
ncbi:serine hydrolase [Flavobacterium sp. J27]|uniref:serine hydrolase domain-containing protein n=1 Tax=Flavobacterium sp. J27 TaxID=2060419 RepID=UPI001031D83C|nr:serine hydrolase domain-containing protein [Flavobacterium sp. J27]